MTASHRPTLEITDRGLRRVDGTSELEIPWERVRRIEAFKRDLVIHDEICVAVMGDSDAQVIVVGEESDGFVDLLMAIAERFPSIPEDWFVRIMLPPFSTQHTLLYDRDGRD